MKLTDFIPLRPHSKRACLVASVAVPAGLPQVISDEIEPFDFNEYLTGGDENTFMIRVVGDSMEAAIFHGDWIIVNRNLNPQQGDVVVACVNGEYMVKTFKLAQNGLRLVPANEKYETRFVEWDEDWEIFGVVTDIFRRIKKI